MLFLPHFCVRIFCVSLISQNIFTVNNGEQYTINNLSGNISAINFLFPTLFVNFALDLASSSGKGADDYVQYLPMTVGYGLGFCGVKPKHSLKDRTIILTMSYATMAIVVRSMKLAFNEKRPDSYATNSFPSGHTATAFMGAQFLYEEYP